jgi:hypothetical protein
MTRFTTQEEVKEALSLIQTTKEKIQNSLNAIIAAHPPILGLDGNPIQESTSKIEAEVTALIKSYLSQPSLDELEQAPQLEVNSFKGSSICVANLLAMMLFSPLAKVSPMMAPMAPQIFSHFLSFLESKNQLGKEDLEGFLAEVISHVRLQATDEQGHTVLLTEEMEREKGNQARTLLSWFLSSCEHLEFISAAGEEGTTSITLTDSGLRVVRHISAANTWLNDVLESKMMLSKNLPPETDFELEK